MNISKNKVLATFICHVSRLLETVLTSTHNVCFVSKIRKVGRPLQTPVFLYKSGFQGGKHFTDMLS